LSSFQEAANYIALSMKPIIKPNQRLIGTVETANPGRGGCGRHQVRYQGRGEGRGRHQYTHGRGRGQGRGRGRGFQPPGALGRGNIHTGYYDDTEWQNLSPDQHTQVLEARGTKQNVSTVTINDSHRNDDLMSAITDVPASVTAASNAISNSNIPPPSNKQGGNAGTQFGRCRIAALTSGTCYKEQTQILSG
jgi:hypothetical protein